MYRDESCINSGQSGKAGSGDGLLYIIAKESKELSWKSRRKIIAKR
jgi:hypothetical protein